MSEKQEYRIPAFLRKDYVPDKEQDPEEVRINELRDQYFERFGEGVEDNISMPFTAQEWIDLLTTCLEKNITFKDLTGYGGYDKDDDSDY